MTDLAYAAALVVLGLLAWDAARRYLVYRQAQLASEAAIEKHFGKYQKAMTAMAEEMRAAIGVRKEDEADLSSRVRHLETTRAVSAIRR